jgi:hypothetical protein
VRAQAAATATGSGSIASAHDWVKIATDMDAKSPLEIMDHVRAPPPPRACLSLPSRLSVRIAFSILFTPY